jgi:hypothetical protein
MKAMRQAVLGLLVTSVAITIVIGTRRGWRPALPGAAEPVLRPLDQAERDWLDAVSSRVDPSWLHSTVESLPGPRNRFDAPEAMSAAEEAVLEAFEEAGWAAERRPYAFDDVGPGGISSYDRVGRYARLEGVNSVASREGEASRDAVVVIAHYDTVTATPGADDNTASVAALLALARVLAPCRFRHSVILAATDMEEIGSFGGYALVAELHAERDVLGLINFETMAYTASEPETQALPPGMGPLFPGQAGRLRARQNRGDFTAVIYDGTAAPMAARFAEGLAHLAGPDALVLLRDPKDLPVVGGLLKRAVPGVRNFSRSDHVPFWEAGVPAIMITDTADFRYPHYHQPTDTHENLDYGRVAAIVVAAAGAVAREAVLEPPGEGPSSAGPRFPDM